MGRLSGAARRPWVRQLALGLFSLYVFALAAVAIGVGSGEVTFGATVWSQPRWVLGEPAALRIAARDPSRRGAFIPGFSAEVALTPAGEATRILAQIDSGHSAQSLRVAVPPDLPAGAARLEVRLTRGDQGDVAAADVELLAAPPPPQAPPRIKAPVPGAEAPPPLRLEVRAAGGVLVPELRQRVLLRLTDAAGAPVEATLALQVRGGAMEGLPSEIRTDVAGLAQAWVRPNYHALTLVGTPAQGAPFEVKVHGKPAQFVADVGPSMIRPGRPVAIEVESMHGTGPVHADVWQAGRWVEATSGLLREGRTRLEVAPPPPGAPALIQVYRHFAAPGKARAIRTVWPAADPVLALPDVMKAAARRDLDAPWRRALASAPPATDPASAELRAAWLLAGWPDKAPDPPVLVDTGPTLRAREAGRRDLLRGRVIGALSATGILVVLVIAYVLVFHVLHLERRYQALGPDEEHPILSRTRAGWEAAILLATIALAIVGLIVMLDGLRWGVNLAP